MALGVKIKNVKTKNSYTIEELYELIKDKPFTAGTPELTKHGATMLITFPALDSHNQVWVMRTGFKASSNKWSIQKQQRAGLTTMAGNMALSTVTRGWSDMKGMVGNNTKICEQLVEETAKELDALGL